MNQARPWFILGNAPSNIDEALIREYPIQNEPKLNFWIGDVLMQRKRREILIGMGLTLALPSQWVKPIINLVSIPAHAQTSPCQVGEWQFAFLFTEDYPLHAPDQRTTVEPPRMETETFFLSKEDVSTTTFTKITGDLTNCPAADCTIWKFTTRERKCDQMTGDIDKLSVDTFGSIGTWVASKIN